MPRSRRQESAISVLGRRVKAFRDERGWSQERLAEAAEMNRSYIAGIEVGRRNPSVKALEKLATALAIPISRLFEA